MVFITEELVRKRSEHNERVISTLEELSLHQEDIEKIEHLQNWCRDLKILLLQSNIISKIENLNKMKNLEYLNLALNNIELIENLEGCESLNKLDLTLNFIGELESVEKLKANRHLETLFLTGNPCTDYEGYREYVIAVLPNLRYFDGVEVERSDRIKAVQAYDLLKPKIVAEQIDYRKKRKHQKKNAEEKQRANLENSPSTADDGKFWKEVTENTPETRIQMAKHKSAIKEQNTEDNTKSNKRQVKLFKPDGRPNNINEAKIPFTIEEDDERNCFVLTIGVYKYLDSTHLDVDVQPLYVTARIKGKVFQITLSEEVSVVQSTAQRSQTTGHLVITMPKVKGEIKIKPCINKPLLGGTQDMEAKNTISKREYLEIGGNDKSMDFSRITEMAKTNASKIENQNIEMKKKCEEKQPSVNFKDDPCVPPLV